MSTTNFKFNSKKAVEAILYIAKRTGDKPTYMRVVKLLYLADKTSLERYGRFISGDFYVAMKDGPVPSHSYDILKAQDAQDNGFEIINGTHPTIEAHRDADIDYLSESDTICLDKILDVYDRYPTWQLRDISHDEAWKETWDEGGQTGSHPIPIERIAMLVENGEMLIEHLQTLNP